jgi:hypothetical protein
MMIQWPKSLGIRGPVAILSVIGWLLNLAVVFLGLGAIVLQSARYITKDEPYASP